MVSSRQALLQHREERRRALHSIRLAALLQTGDASSLIFYQFLQAPQATPFFQQIRFRHLACFAQHPTKRGGGLGPRNARVTVQ